MRFKIQILWFLLVYTLRGTFRTRAALERFQERKLNRFLRTMRYKSTFYKGNSDGVTLSHPVTHLAQLPILNKTLFMAHFDEINTVGIHREEAMQVALQAEESRDFAPEINGITIGLSTGTSGKRGLFLASVRERAQWTALILHRVVRWRLFERRKVAFFLRANSNLYTSVQSRILDFQFFDIFRPLPDLLIELQALQPHILAAQPSLLRAIADAQQAGQLHLQPLQIISFAEVLYKDDRAFIEQVFGCIITEVYQCTEGFLGASCGHGTLHLNEDVAIFEKKQIADRHFIPIVTDFIRTAQPVIRYEMTDVLVERATPCPCGSALLALERIEGRTDDVLLFKRKGKIISVFPDLFIRKIARATDDFGAYKVIQVCENQIDVQLETIEEHRRAAQEHIKNAITEVLAACEISEVSITFTDQIMQNKGAKHRRVERLYNPFGVMSYK